MNIEKAKKEIKSLSLIQFDLVICGWNIFLLDRQAILNNRNKHSLSIFILYIMKGGTYDT